MVAKTMDQQEFCSSCVQKQNCGDVYRRLGNSQGPSIVLNVIIAFVLPLVAFIGFLALFEVILARVIEAEVLQTVVSVVLAVVGASICVLTAKVIKRQLRR